MFQFQLVWKTSMPMYGTAPAFKKGSIYSRFFKQTILDLTHAIQLNELDKSKFKIDCINDTEDVAPISFRKVVLLYVILGSTFLTSFLILICEFMFHYSKRETLSIWKHDYSLIKPLNKLQYINNTWLTKLIHPNPM